MTEARRIESGADWYLTKQLDFDKALIQLRYRTIRPHFRGTTALELGSADGVMTRLLYRDFSRLTVVDAAGQLLDAIAPQANLVKVHSLFEDFRPTETFDTVILDHILEHVEEPVKILNLATSWLSGSGALILGVPNANSIHRLAAVKMGLLSHQTQLNTRDIALGHRRVFTSSSLKELIQLAGLRIEIFGGVFLKPLSNGQIQDHWTPEMIEGFFKLGEEFPEYCADLFAVCSHLHFPQQANQV